MRHWWLVVFLVACERTPPPTASTFKSVCAACHGQRGEGNETLGAPSIAGLPEWYVTAQLERFRAGQRGFHPTDVHGLTMSAIAKAIPLDQAKAAAEEVATLPRVPPIATITDANLDRGRELYADRCMECHRYNGEGEIVFGSAPLVGLSDRYLLEQLHKFAQDHRGTDPQDLNGQKMRKATALIESEQAMRDVVAYIVTLNSRSE